MILLLGSEQWVLELDTWNGHIVAVKTKETSWEDFHTPIGNGYWLGRNWGKFEISNPYLVRYWITQTKGSLGVV